MSEWERKCNIIIHHHDMDVGAVLNIESKIYVRAIL